MENIHSSIQWCSGKFSLVGTLAWHHGHIPYRYRGEGGCLNEWSFIKVKNLCSNMGYIFLDTWEVL